MNPIDILIKNNFKMTSNPHTMTPFGFRNYTVNRFNYDAYCGGFHRAYDFAKHDGAAIPAVMSGVVVQGTSNYGNFGGTVVIANKALGYQVIYGHLKRNLIVTIGQHVKYGETIGYQGDTNNLNVPMASHLHIQFQRYGYLKEKDFVCNGISAYDIDLRKDRYFNGIFIPKYNMNIRGTPSLNGKIISSAKPKDNLAFNSVTYKDGHYWLKLNIGYVSSGTQQNIYGHFK
ncbi:M23 family metallopeptidase [Nosocomiicoccus massiliensis]|uniref:lysostaphin n=1 Tax=Nosocomiicoccus massiliensis TaxID=1232430 RepID=A0AAF0YLV0_9STAP|nr:M23 family metallopeptidase [Nosocomiicoccus massiliensis]WOS96119.1 M23 family metallopeptidase [Nosocomiicoccus massiliensis]